MEQTSEISLETICAKESWTAEDQYNLVQVLADGADAADKMHGILSQMETENPQPRGSAAVKIGMARLLVCRFTQACEAFKAGTDNKECNYYHAQSLKCLKKYDDTIAALAKAKASGWDADEIDVEVIEIMALKGEVEQADQALAGLGEDLADKPYYLCCRGLVDELNGDVQSASEAYEKAVEIQEDCVPALFRLGYLAGRVGEDDEAIYNYEQCLKHRPTYVNALLNLAVLYSDTEEYDAAIDCLNRILKANPRHERARLFMRDAKSSKTMYYDENQAKVMAKRNAVLATPVSDFELSVRARNCLKKMGIDTLGDLVRTPESRLLEYKNFGETSLHEIRDMLSSKSLRVGQALEESGTIELAELTAPIAALGSSGEGVLATPLEQVELSVRSRKALSELGCFTLNDICRRSEAELLACRNFGQTSLNEIRQRLTEYNVRLREPE